MNDAEFQAVFDQHKDAVYRLAWRMSRSPAAAEDITQDALKHWRAGHRFEPLDDDAVVVEPLDLERGDVGDMVGRAVGALRPLQREVVMVSKARESSSRNRSGDARRFSRHQSSIVRIWVQLPE